MKAAIITSIFILIFQSNLVSQWIKVESIYSYNIYSALFYDNNILIGGDSLYISRDKGVTWNKINPAAQVIETTALLKVNANIFLGTYGNGVFVSSDNGESWQSYNNGLNGYALFAKKFAYSGDTLFYGTDGGGIYFSILGTGMWHSYNENLPSNIAWTINDLVVTNSNLIASAGYSGFYYIRPKGSAQWIEKRIQTPNGAFTTPRTFLSINNIVFSGSSAGIYRSLNEGLSFDSVGISALPLSVVSFASDGNRVYAGFTRSNDFFVWYSDDLGNTWNVFDHEFQFLNNIYVYDNKIWAGTNNGLWYKKLNPNSVEPILNIKEFKLHQNFPNPFNPKTIISWQSPTDAWQSLKIYDVLGNEVKTLVNEFKPAGKYEVEFVSNGLASGIYFYTLRVGNFTETKKMILLE
ncbi:MAG: T9SS type A sorting domain-containing protein [Ignavibacterium sp.]